MAHAYTPGLTVTPLTMVRRERRLPLKGRVLVEVGQTVEADTVVARCELPGAVHAVNIASRLAVDPARAHEHLSVAVGTWVEEGAVVATGRSLFGMVRTSVAAPCAGTLESVSPLTGQLLVRAAPVPVGIQAYMRGVVSEVIPGEGVVVESRAALVQGIFGVGGETCGPLAFAVEAPSEALSAGRIGTGLRGCVVVGGAYASADALRRARDIGAVAVIVGGIEDGDLRELLGRDIGVAVTGSESLGITVVLTEGFGRIPMSRRTWDLLRMHEGRGASVSGATQIRAGVLRPEVLIAHEEAAAGAPIAAWTSLEKGAWVRVIREPWFGRVGRVAALPSDLQALETEALVRVVEVELADDHSRVLVPRANVELVGG
jgi:hypothetical protein